VVGLDALGTAEVLISEADMSLTDAAGELARLHSQHDVTGIAVDETGLGAGVVEMLEGEVGRRAIDGVKFTLDRKQSLYNRLKSDLENGEVTLSYHGQLLREMKQLRYQLTGRGKTKIEHPDGGHDDHCDALALAARAHRGGGGVRTTTSARRLATKTRRPLAARNIARRLTPRTSPATLKSTTATRSSASRCRTSPRT